MSDTTPDSADALNELSKAVEIAQSTAVNASTSTDMVLSTDTAAATKARFAGAHAEVAHATKAAMAKYESAKAVIEAQRRDLEAQARAMAAELEPLQKLMARLQEGIGAVNLYLGRDEYLEELRGGESAPAGTPLHVRQLVLAMDEESALHAEAGGIDFKKIDDFIEWMLADPANLDQVLPDAKGVVTIMARRTEVDYVDDAMANARANEQNFATWFLLRNGERLFLMATDFSVGRKLLPGREDFNKIFQVREHDGSTRSLTPGTGEWIRAEEQASAQTRHYMKVALILQGLVDRTAVFHPLPAAGLNLLGEADYAAGNIIRVEDDDLAIGTGRPSFKDWQKAALDKLDVGHRVIGHFPGYFGRYETNRITPKNASAPQALVAHTITRRDAQHLYFTYDRTDTVYRGYYDEDGQAKTRATYSLDASPYGTVAYVPLDNVDVADMRYYLGSRSERHEYLSMFPALKAAIAFKEAEELAETPFRTLLTQALVSQNLVVEDSAEAETKALITWWKTANKWHRALNGEPAHEARAQRGILTEARRRAGSAGAEKIVAGIRAAVPGAMVIAARTNDLIAVEAQPRRYGRENAVDNVWVRITEFTKTGKQKTTSEWKSLTRAQVAKWTILEQNDAWDGWKFNADLCKHLTDDAIDRLVAGLIAETTRAVGAPTVVKYSEDTSLACPVALVHFVSERRRAHWSSKSESATDLSQGYKRFYIKVVKGEAVVPELKSTISLDWLSWRTDRDGSPESPLEVNYSDNYRDAIVYRDEARLAEDTALAEEWAGRVAVRRVRDTAVRTLAGAVERAWSAAEVEARRARFIEDFGDETLWTDHSKSQKAARYSAPEGLDTMLATVIDNGIDVAGRNLAEVVMLTGAAIELPEDFASIVLPATDAKAAE